MIRLDLTTKQRNEVKAGAAFVMLNDNQAKSIRGRINAASKQLSCECGLPTCKTCSARERKRQQRAAAKRPAARKQRAENRSSS